jgi:hypothetical protein
VHEATLPAGLNESPGTPPEGYYQIALASGQDFLDADFGYRLFDGTLAGIGDYVWSDSENDGVQDPGEPGIGGVEVSIYRVNSDGSLTLNEDAVDQNGVAGGITTTEADGSYFFSGLAPGEYVVQLAAGPGTPLENFFATSGPQSEGSDTSDPVTVAAGDIVTDVDFGWRNTNQVDIKDTVWFDADNDGILDAGEYGIPGVTVDLVDCGLGSCDDGDERVVASALSDANGNFEFDGVQDGDYLIVITDKYDELAGLGGTTSPAAAGSLPVTVAGVDVVGINFGYSNGVTVGDTVFSDSDGDGIQDKNELGIGGVEVQLWQDDGDGEFDPVKDTFIGTQTTAADGSYLFAGLPSSTYFVSVDDTQAALIGYTPTTVDQELIDQAGTDSTEIAAALTTTAQTVNVVNGYLDFDGDGDVGPAESDPTADDGIAHGVSVFGGRLDLNDDGVVNGADDGWWNGILVENGWLDLDGGGISASDSGVVNVSQPAVTTADFGYRNESLLDIAGTVWNDYDKNGVREPNAPDNEPGIQAVTLALLDEGGNVIATTTSGNDGSYLFPDVPDGTYTVVVTDKDDVLNGYILTSGLDAITFEVNAAADAADGGLRLCRRHLQRLDRRLRLVRRRPRRRPGSVGRGACRGDIEPDRLRLRQLQRRRRIHRRHHDHRRLGHLPVQRPAAGQLLRRRDRRRAGRPHAHRRCRPDGDHQPERRGGLPAGRLRLRAGY